MSLERHNLQSESKSKRAIKMLSTLSLLGVLESDALQKHEVSPEELMRSFESISHASADRLMSDFVARTGLRLQDGQYFLTHSLLVPEDVEMLNKEGFDRDYLSRVIGQGDNLVDTISKNDNGSNVCFGVGGTFLKYEGQAIPAGAHNFVIAVSENTAPFVTNEEYSIRLEGTADSKANALGLALLSMIEKYPDMLPASETTGSENAIDHPVTTEMNDWEEVASDNFDGSLLQKQVVNITSCIVNPTVSVEESAEGFSITVEGKLGHIEYENN